MLPSRTGGVALSIFLASILLPAADQNPAPARLVEIRVLGSKRYAEAEIIRATELTLGATVAPAVFQEAANKLAATGAFSEVNYNYTARPGSLTVEFRVTDGGDFGACNFDNLVWFSDRELRARIREMVPLFGDEIPLKGDIPAKVEVALEYLLQEKGVPGSVQIMGAGAMGGSLAALQFSVQGVRLVIQQVEFTGAQAVEPATLVAAIQPLLASDYDQSFVSEFVRRNVGPLYARLGYLKVAFGAPQVRLLAGSAQDLAVTIPVAEGDPYRLREIRWEGNQAVPTHELAPHVSVMPGQPADTVQMEKDLDGILQLYAARGYIAARLNFAPEFDDNTSTVAFHVRIQEGDRYSMGKLEIAGLDPVRAESLRKTSELVPGQPYNRAYWNTFISKSGRLLPASRTPWKATPKETIHAETKTVDVTLTFAPETGD